MKTLLFTLLFSIPLFAQNIVINEVQSSNVNTLEDEEGDYPDWIEFYNPTEETVDLTGYMLTDTWDEIKWSFPSGSIAPNDFLVVFASGKNRAFPNLHTSFKINSDGETIILTDPDSNVIDTLEAFTSDKNVSYARIPDGQDSLDFCYTPTPNAPNSLVSYNPLNISHPSAFYSAEISLNIAAQKEENTIHYTLDGSLPTPQSSIFQDSLLISKNTLLPISLSTIPTTPLEGPDYWVDFVWKPPQSPLPQAQVLRYQSFQDGQANSPVYTHTYFLQDDVNDPFDFCVLSLVTDSIHLFSQETGIYVPGSTFENHEDAWWEYWPQGNYYGLGKVWERPAYLSFFEEDGTLGFEQNIGLRIKGFGSAALPQKSFNVFARTEYGNNEINYPIFTDNLLNTYKRLSLRNSGNDFLQTHFRDALLQSLLTDLDLETQAFRPSILFINGEYWGIYNIRERYTRHYFESYFGVEKYDLDLLENQLVIEEGDSLAFQAMWDYIESHDLSKDQHYDFIANQLDIDNCIDYHIAQIFLGNYDWPGNNVAVWRQRSTNGKWRWLTFDLDLAFGFLKEGNLGYEANSLRLATEAGSEVWPNFDWSTLLFRNLLKQTDFQNRFLERFEFHLNHTFHRDTLLNRINDFERLYETAMPSHIQRWGYPRRMESWRGEINVMREFAMKRACFVKAQLLDFFDLEHFGYDCGVNDSLFVSEPIQIFPNPASTSTRIVLGVETIRTTSLFLYNTQGKIVLEKQQDLHEGINIIEVELENLPSGVYFLRMTDVMNQTFKLVVR